MRILDVLLVESAPDPASVGIARALRELVEWDPLPAVVAGAPLQGLGGQAEVGLVRIPQLHLNAEPLEAALEAAGLRPGAIVFLSKHKAVSGRPSLTVHPVGNFGEAKFGGQPRRLAPAAPGLQTALLRALARQVERTGYASEVTFEVTHHGPLLSTPTCFVELGSGEAQWSDPVGAGVVARAVLDAATATPSSNPVAVGLGGGHYAPRFTEVALARGVDFGHFIPAHAAQAVPDPAATLRDAVAATPGATGVYLHRGGLNDRRLDPWVRAVEALGLARLDSRPKTPA